MIKNNQYVVDKLYTDIVTTTNADGTVNNYYTGGYYDGGYYDGGTTNIGSGLTTAQLDKLNSIQYGAEVNQFAFSFINVNGSTSTLSAINKTDTIVIEGVSPIVTTIVDGKLQISISTSDPTTGIGLANLKDVLITNPQNNDSLIYNSGKWINSSTGSGTNPIEHLFYDSVNNKLWTNVPFYSTGEISAYGIGNGTGGGGGTGVSSLYQLTDVAKDDDNNPTGVLNAADEAVLKYNMATSHWEGWYISDLLVHTNRAQLDVINQDNIDVLSRLTYDAVHGCIRSIVGLQSTGEITAYTTGDGTGGGTGSATSLSELTDVIDTLNPINGDVLYYDNVTTKWINKASSSLQTDLTGYATETYVTTKVNDLINGAPAAYDTLKEIADVLQTNINSIGDIITTLGTKWTQDNTKITNWDSAYTHSLITGDSTIHHIHTNKSLLDLLSQENIDVLSHLTYDEVNNKVKVDISLYSTDEITAYSTGSDSSGSGSVLELSQLTDIVDGWTPLNADILYYDSTLGKWKNVASSTLRTDLSGYSTEVFVTNITNTKWTQDNSKITNWDLAYTNNHTHSNKTVLDGIISTDITNWNNKETSLGNPTTSGYLLSSTVSGVRNWVAPYSHPAYSSYNVGGTRNFITSFTSDTLGHITSITSSAMIKNDIETLLTGDSITSHYHDSRYYKKGELFELKGTGTIEDPYKIEAKYNFYGLGEVSAYGVGSGGSGGGLIQTVYSYGDLGGSFSDTILTDTFNAYTINKINADLGTRISSLESGSALSVTTTGSGNAITSLSKTGTIITATLGGTFSLSSHIHNLSTLTNDAGFIYSNDARLSDARTASDVYSWAKASVKPAYIFSEIGSLPTTLGGYGITDSVRFLGNIGTSANPVFLDKNVQFGWNRTDGSGEFDIIIKNGTQAVYLSGFTWDGTTLTKKYQIDSNGIVVNNNTVWHTGNLTPSNYLPLAGGTISGKLIVQSSTYAPIQFLNNDYPGNSGLLLMGGANDLVIRNLIGTSTYDLRFNQSSLRYNNYTVYHSGNSNLGTIDWNAKALTLGGKLTFNADYSPSIDTINSTTALTFGIGGVGKIALSTVNEFRPFSTQNNVIALGSTIARWSNIYSVNGNFSGDLTTNGIIRSSANDLKLYSSSAYLLRFVQATAGWTDAVTTSFIQTGDATNLALTAANGSVLNRVQISTGSLQIGNISYNTFTVPAYQFEVLGTSRFSDNSLFNGYSLSIQNETGNRYIFSRTASQKIGFWTGGDSAIASNVDMKFKTGHAFDDVTYGTEKMRLTTGGNLLIGITTDSGYKLDVAGPGRFIGLLNADSGIQIGSARLLYDATNNALYVQKSDGTSANFYATGEVSAYGTGTGTTGGGGIIQTVYSYGNLGGSYLDTDLTNTFNAYTIDKLATRINSLEGGSALTFNTTGAGNAITSISKTGTTVTSVLGSTFSLDGHTHNIITNDSVSLLLSNGSMYYTYGHQFYTRHITGINTTSDGTSGTDSDLYLNYGNTTGKINLGSIGSYYISTDGGYYSGNVYASYRLWTTSHPYDWYISSVHDGTYFQIQAKSVDNTFLPVSVNHAYNAGNSDTLDGYHMCSNNSNNGITWGYIPCVKPDGVMEVGKYIDFHEASNDGIDYNVRLYSSANNLYLNSNTIWHSGNSNLSTVDWKSRNNYTKSIQFYHPDNETVRGTFGYISSTVFGSGYGLLLNLDTIPAGFKNFAIYGAENVTIQGAIHFNSTLDVADNVTFLNGIYAQKSDATCYNALNLYNTYAYGDSNKAETRINLGKIEGGTTYEPMGAIGASPVINLDSNHGSLYFYTRTSQALTEKARILSSGNLLVGTTTDAGYKLDVNGAGRFTGNVTAPTFLGSLSGNADSATKLATVRTISVTGVVTGSGSFDGSGNLAIATSVAANSVTLGTNTVGNYALSVGVSGSGLSITGAAGEGIDFIVNSNATNLNTASTLVFRDASGNFSAGTITAALSGNASTATSLLNSRTLWGQSFNGSANISGALSSVTTITMNGALSGGTTASFSSYITADRFYTGYDAAVSNSFSCSNWFRSNGQTGWINSTYGGGIYMLDSTYVQIYGSKAFKVTSTANDSINTAGGIQIGSAQLIYDAANNAIYVRKSDGSAANFYATGEVSAYGMGGVSGTKMDDLIFANSGTTTRQIQFNMGDNDYGRIACGAAALNAGWLEIATADDGTEPIYVRQYSGAFGTVVNQLTLLDSYGNTAMTGSLNIGSNIFKQHDTAAFNLTLYNTSGGTRSKISLSDSTVSITGAITSTGSGTFNGGSFSSLRSLKNVHEDWNGNALNEISKVKVRSFNYKSEPIINKTLGFIIDEIPDSISEYVLFGKEKDSINLYTLHALSFLAHQQTKTRLEELEEEVIDLKQKINELENKQNG
jgi:hypothetical protein